ncbi:MAG: VWA domain-containing protein [Spirochaetes bacterium]|nr:VWA domain-containing protein [Spirochaetota bacterium]
MSASASPQILNRVYDFVDILRDANVSISTDEILSLCNALDHTTVDNRRIFKQTLQTTLIKDYTDIPAFEKCFEQFFLSRERDERIEEIQSEALGRRPNGEGLSAAENRLEHELGDSMDSYLDSISEKLLLQKDAQELLALFMEEMEQAGSSGGMGIALFKTRRSMFARDHSEDEVPATDEERELYGRLLEMMRGRSGKRRIGRSIKNHEQYLLNKYIYQLKPHEIKEMREVVKRFGQKLKNRISLRKKRVKHGGIDVKRTFRASLQFGGVPFKIFHKDRKIDRPQLVVLCDVSSSVNQYSRFMLLLTHTLQSLFSKVRTFAFIGNLVEITGLFMEMDPERAINSIFNDTDFTYGWGSNYGRSFDQFMEQHSDSLTKKTTILIIGDARNNNQDPGMNSFIKMKERSRNIYWLNPEKRHLWDWSDSIASLYMKYCTNMKEVNSILDLTEFIDRLFIK